MKKIILLLVALAAIYHFKPHWLPSFGSGGSFDANGQATVVVFTFTDCGAPCNDTLGLLREKKLPYEEVNVSNDSEGKKRLNQLGGGSNFPVTFVGNQRVDGFQRTDLTHALAKGFGLGVLDRRQRRAVETHFDESGQAKVVMYGTAWCPYCKKAREFFTDKNIDYIEVDVEKSAQGMAHYKALQSSGYPLIYVGVNRFSGLDKSGILAALDDV